MSFDTKNSYLFMGNINSESVEKLIRWFVARAAESTHLHLTINSSGGWVDTAFAFVDIVTNSQVRLDTLVIGEASSMAIPMFLTGEHRVVAPNSRFRFHELGRSFGKDTRYSTTEMRNILSSLDDSQRIYAEFVSKKSLNIASEGILDMMKEEVTINASQAVKLGLAHKILSKEISQI